MLSLGCALLDPIDAIPTSHGAASSATGGTDSAMGGTNLPIGGAASGLGSSGANGGATPNTGGTAGRASVATRCVVNADCDPNSRCLPEHVCVRLDTDTTGPCPRLIGSEFASDPNAIFIGAFAPLDQDSVGAKTISAVYEMAAAEFNELGGLRGVGGGRPSPLVVIVCNNSSASTSEALHHLIVDARVPAVLAAMDPNGLLAGFNAYPDTFFVSAFSGSEELANVSDGRAWTMLGQPSDYGDIYAALLPNAEALVHADLIRAGKDRDTIRIAAVTEAGNAFAEELANEFLPRLTFNGMKVAEQPTNYLGRELTKTASNLNQVVADLYQFQPDIVLSFASGVFTAKFGVMPLLDQGYWPDERPVFILSPENAPNDQDVTSELSWLRAFEHRDNVSRVLGVGPAGLTSSVTDAFNSFALRLTTQYPGTSADFGNYYDAFYFLVDAIYAGPRAAFRDGTISAEDLATGMRRLTNLGNAKYNVGPKDISKVWGLLDGANSTLELDGTMGAPDFDRTTGMRRESGSIYCFDSTGLGIQKDTIRYTRATQQLEQVEHPLCLINFLSQ